jgi:hypothetical protein
MRLSLVTTTRLSLVGPIVTSLVLLTGCPGSLDAEQFGGIKRPGSDTQGAGADFCNAPTVHFAKSCGSALCHEGPAAEGGIDLISPGLEQRLLNKPAAVPGCEDLLLIDPQNPQDSFLLEKVASVSPSCGYIMPLGAFEADQELVACTSDWISAVVGGKTGSVSGEPDGVGIGIKNPVPTPENPDDEITPTPDGPLQPLNQKLDRTGWSAVASGSAENAPASHALDGNLASRWSTGAAQSGNETLTIDMGATKAFFKIELESRGDSEYNDYPRGYELSVSEDGSSFTPIRSEASASAANPLVIQFQTAQSGRYIRIRNTGSDPAAWWSVYEFWVYN